MIWSHAGGTMPFLIERFTNAAREDFKAELRAIDSENVARLFPKFRA